MQSTEKRKKKRNIIHNSILSVVLGVCYIISYEWMQIYDYLKIKKIN